MSRGIDYGSGCTNIDHETGIRYGVIPQNAVLQMWADSSEPDYGEPHCPKCGNEAVPFGKADVDREDYTGSKGSCQDYACDDCKLYWDSWEVFGDEPLGFVLDDETYQASSDSHGDIWVFKSPYYTRAQFCSPCAPGACYLLNPCEGGEKAYCFGPGWFGAEWEPCPYPVWKVEDDTCVYTVKSLDVDK